MFVEFLGKTHERNKKLFLLTISQWCVFNIMMDAATQMLGGDKNHPIGVEDLVLGLEEYENSHTLTTTTPGSNNSQNEVNNQIDNQNQCSVPHIGPFFTGSWSCLKSSSRHTISNNLSR